MSGGEIIGTLGFEEFLAAAGYPGVVLKYLEKASLQNCQAELLKIIRLFSHESRRYFEDILDDAVYDNLFCGVALLQFRFIA